LRECFWKLRLLGLEVYTQRHHQRIELQRHIRWRRRQWLRRRDAAVAMGDTSYMTITHCCNVRDNNCWWLWQRRRASAAFQFQCQSLSGTNKSLRFMPWGREGALATRCFSSC
jgi:hypothetical protein